MSEAVKREIEINAKQIMRDLQTIIDGGMPTEDLTKTHFEGIRMLVDHCEKLALENV
mgnify:CR=1 FL=1